MRLASRFGGADVMLEEDRNMKTTQPLFVVDAFTGKGLRGNPAAVCPLQSWPSDAVMQALAHKLALSETAYFVPDADTGYLLRWFTPETEVELCGHATLASTAIFFRQINPAASTVRFRSLKAGELTVTRDGDLLELDFPSEAAEPAPVQGIADALCRTRERGVRRTRERSRAQPRDPSPSREGGQPRVPGTHGA